MIKRLLTLSILLLPIMLVAVPTRTTHAFDLFGSVCNDTASQDDPATPENEASSVCADKSNTTNPLTGADGLLLRAARLFATITGIASFIMIIFGSIKYVTSGGDTSSSGGKPSSVESAKNTILYALVGLVVSLLSVAIIVFVVNKLK